MRCLRSKTNSCFSRLERRDTFDPSKMSSDPALVVQDVTAHPQCENHTCCDPLESKDEETALTYYISLSHSDTKEISRVSQFEGRANRLLFPEAHLKHDVRVPPTQKWVIECIHSKDLLQTNLNRENTPRAVFVETLHFHSSRSSRGLPQDNP